MAATVRRVNDIIEQIAEFGERPDISEEDEDEAESLMRENEGNAVYETAPINPFDPQFGFPTDDEIRFYTERPSGNADRYRMMRDRLIGRVETIRGAYILVKRAFDMLAGIMLTKRNRMPYAWILFEKYPQVSQLRNKKEEWEGLEEEFLDRSIPTGEKASSEDDKFVY